MTAGSRSRDEGTDPDPPSPPDISVCESRPDTSVFIEADNSDGWIASDVTVDVERQSSTAIRRSASRN